MPTAFTTYDTATGEIVMTQFVGDLEEARANEHEGQATIEGFYNGGLYKIVDGEPVQKTTEEMITNRPPP